MNRCASCRHWSEMMAQVLDGQLTAMCLNQASPSSQQYVPKGHGCNEHEGGDPVDIDYVPAGQRERSLQYRAKLRGETS